MAGNILLVDDSVLIQKVVELTFEEQGTSVQISENPADALALVRRLKPSVVLVSAQLKSINGLELCEQLHGEADLSGIPVLMLLNPQGGPSTEQALRAGAAGTIFKPFEPEKLLTEVNRIISAALGGGEAGSAASAEKPADPPAEDEELTTLFAGDEEALIDFPGEAPPAAATEAGAPDSIFSPGDKPLDLEESSELDESLDLEKSLDLEALSDSPEAAAPEIPAPQSGDAAEMEKIIAAPEPEETPAVSPPEAGADIPDDQSLEAAESELAALEEELASELMSGPSETAGAAPPPAEVDAELAAAEAELASLENELSSTLLSGSEEASPGTEAGDAGDGDLLAEAEIAMAEAELNAIQGELNAIHSELSSLDEPEAAPGIPGAGKEDTLDLGISDTEEVALEAAPAETPAADAPAEMEIGMEDALDLEEMEAPAAAGMEKEDGGDAGLELEMDDLEGEPDLELAKQLAEQDKDEDTGEKEAIPAGDDAVRAALKKSVERTIESIIPPMLRHVEAMVEEILPNLVEKVVLREIEKIKRGE